jgi:laccase
MAHPIHLHGHYFRVLGSAANSTFPANMTIADVASRMPDSPAGMNLNIDPTAPRRDSAHLPEAGWLAIRFVADNPGVWLLHCHINSHLSVCPFPRVRQW